MSRDTSGQVPLATTIAGQVPLATIIASLSTCSSGMHQQANQVLGIPSTLVSTQVTLLKQSYTWSLGHFSTNTLGPTSRAPSTPSITYLLSILSQGVVSTDHSTIRALYLLNAPYVYCPSQGPLALRLVQTRELTQARQFSDRSNHHTVWLRLLGHGGRRPRQDMAWLVPSISMPLQHISIFTNLSPNLALPWSNL